MQKDLRIASETSKSVGASLEFTEKTLRVYEEVERRGLGRADFGVAFNVKRGR